MIFDKNINIVIAGEAGQGIETAVQIVSKLLHINKYYVFSTSEYMSRIRGGSNSSLIKVSDEKTPSYSNKIDVLFALDNKVFEHLKNRITNETISLDIKSKNFYVVGYILAIFKLEQNDSLGWLKNDFSEFFSVDVAEKNTNDFNEGFADGVNNTEIIINFNPNRSEEDNMFISVNDALGLGCIAGGCNFLPFYPMSPSTFLQAFLTKNADDFGIVSRQVEDEICVINMALGAWFAGARALACTSGGGFALMCEGVSLAGMTESPIVINIAQRPGPATGLPTRTEQGDLNLALYSGHGEFPRIILAPCGIEDAFKIGQVAFNLADKYQVPVFILTDQAMLDSSYNTKGFKTDQKNERYIVKSTLDYKRYQLSDNPVSPRSIPNYGEGIVCVDSDEHDETGYLTEDSLIREKMVQKRLNKLDLIKEEVIEPYFIGGNEYKFLIISWGSNFNVIKEAIRDKSDFALLHFVQIYPVSEKVIEYHANAQKLIIIEQNAKSEFADLLKREFDFVFDEKLLKYNGDPFSVEEINTFLEGVVSEI